MKTTAWLSSWMALAVACQPPVAEGPAAPAAVVHVSPAPAGPEVEPAEPDHHVPEPVSLLGQSRNDPVVEAFLASHGGQVELSEYPESRYHVVKSRGFALLEEDGVIGTVFLYSEGHEDHRQYQGPLPRGLRFEDTREVVREKLGAPDKSGGGPGSVTSLGPVAGWDKWYEPSWSLHVQYGDSSTIQLVTLMTRSHDPHR